MQVSVKKTGTEYVVTIGDKTVTLPLESKQKEDRKRRVSILGTDTKRLEIDPYSNEIDLVKSSQDPSESILSEDDADDEERERIVMDLSMAWANRDETEGGRRRRSRVNRKTRRSQRKRRQTKRR